MSIVLKFLDITHQSRLHQVVPRTTLNIDQPVLKELQRLQKQSGKSLGALVSELLVEALEVRSRGGGTPPPRLQWTSAEMGTPIVNLLDKEALFRVLDQA